jgi:hypothetical protein
LDSYPACRDAHSTPLAVPVPTPTTAAEPRRQARTRTIYTSKGCRPATCAQRRSSRLPLPPVDARTHACCRARTNLAQPACHYPAPPSMRASSLRAPSICHHACLPCSACGCSIASSLAPPSMAAARCLRFIVIYCDDEFSSRVVREQGRSNHPSRACVRARRC